MSCFAGGHWDNICCHSNFYLRVASILDDRVRVGGSQVLLFLLLHIHVLHLLFYVWDDGCCPHSWPSDCCNYYVIFPQLLELVLWFPHPQAGTCFRTLIFFPFSCIQMSWFSNANTPQKTYGKSFHLKPPKFAYNERNVWFTGFNKSRQGVEKWVLEVG